MKKILFILSGVVVAFMATAATSAPYDLYVEPGTHSCEVTWEDDENSAWNLRYRLFSEEPEGAVLLHALSGSNYSGNYAAVTFPAPWGGTNTYKGNGVFYFRNNYNGANSPGNITYTIPAGYENATFTMKITAASTSYGAGNLAVGTPQTAAVNYYFSAGSSHEWTVKGSSGEKITVTTTDANYSLDITLIEVYELKSNEWTYVNNIEKMAYTIEDLEMDTDYEVQVQAIGDDGTLSDWTRPDVFTTLAEEPFIPSVHILGDIDDQYWAPDLGTKMAYDPETELYTATIHVEDGRSFGFTTELDVDDLGGWNYLLPYRFGPECDDDILTLTDDVMGKTLNLSFDNWANVKVLEIGDYEVTVSLEQNYIIIGKVVPDYQIGDVNKDGFINVSDVTTLISAILNSTTDVETDNFSPAAANVNGDAMINVTDVTMLISMILSAS